MPEQIPKLLPKGVLMTGIVGLVFVFITGVLFRENIPVTIAEEFMKWASAFGVLFILLIVGSFVPMQKFKKR